MRKLFVVGIGPGSPLDRTIRAEKAIKQSSVIVGYRKYLELISDITKDKELIYSGMTREVERCRIALSKAGEGNVVSLVSSGDPGVYGMAGLAIEIAHSENMSVSIEVIPGLTSATAAAARMGAPLMLDFACISLSDLLVPWKTIVTRLGAVAQSDLVTALFNPRSKRRIYQLDEAAKIFCEYRDLTTPVGIATDLGSANEKIIISDLDHFLDEEIGMRSIVLIGNKSSRLLGEWFITPRGYKI